MRTIPLSQPDGSLGPDALADLMSLALFPEDGTAREQAMMIWRSERARYQMEGEVYRPSSIARLIANIHADRVARMTLAGYVAIVLTVLHAFGRPMHLKTAASIVSDLMRRDKPGDARVHRISSVW